MPVAADATLTPIYASPEQLRALFNIKRTMLNRLERGRHPHSATWPKGKMFGGLKLYEVAQVKAFIDALPAGQFPRRYRRRAA
jgi:hypothetical protein